jgi:hypothetical protein
VGCIDSVHHSSQDGYFQELWNVVSCTQPEFA